MAIPATSWDETSPPDTQARSLGDDRIRELKTQIREIIAVDHKMESSGQGETWGYHNQATIISSISNPTATTDSIILFTKDYGLKSELYFIDESGNVQQLTQGGSWIGGMTKEVRMWYGTLGNIPSGWGLCSGVDGKPDHYEKFTRGINTSTTEPRTNYTAISNNSKTLTISNIPNHTHATNSNGGHTHRINHAGSGTLNPSGPAVQLGTPTNASGYFGNSDGQHVHSVSSTGSGNSFDNQPAYYELAFLVKL